MNVTIEGISSYHWQTNHDDGVRRLPGAALQALAASPAAGPVPALMAIARAVGGGLAAAMRMRAAAIPLAMGAALVAEALIGDPVVIDPIGIPKALEEHGYSPEIAARRLRDEMMLVVGETRTYKERRGFQTSDAQLDVEDPLSGFRLRTLLRLGRQFIGAGETRLSGEIVEDGERFHLNLRSSRSEMGVARVAQPRLSGEEKRGAEELLRAAAAAALRMTDPVLLAAHRFDRAFTRDPASGVPDRGALESALALLDDHLAGGASDDLVRAHNLYGLILYHRGDYHGAIGHFTRAARAIDTGRSADAAVAGTVYSNWGDALVALHADAEAAETFALAIEADPRRASHRIDRGNALLRLGHAKDAIASFEQAVALAPDDPHAYAGWADALTALGRDADAAEKRRQAARMSAS